MSGLDLVSLLGSTAQAIAGEENSSVVAAPARISSVECESKYVDPITNDYRLEFNNKMGRIIFAFTR